MGTIYFTADADGGRIVERAAISKARSKEEALAILRAAYLRSDFEVLGIEVGRFGDCWIKCLDAATYESKREKWEREAGELVVRIPGQHPGGQAYWIEPVAEIYVPILQEKAGALKAGDAVRLTSAHKADLTTMGLYSPSDEKTGRIIQVFREWAWVDFGEEGTPRILHIDNIEATGETK